MTMTKVIQVIVVMKAVRSLFMHLKNKGLNLTFLFSELTKFDHQFHPGHRNVHAEEVYQCCRYYGSYVSFSNSGKQEHSTTWRYKMLPSANGEWHGWHPLPIPRTNLLLQPMKMGMPWKLLSSLIFLCCCWEG